MEVAHEKKIALILLNMDLKKLEGTIHFLSNYMKATT
jgi:predicted transcriptional regulator YheO